MHAIFHLSATFYLRSSVVLLYTLRLSIQESQLFNLCGIAFFIWFLLTSRTLFQIHIWWITNIQTFLCVVMLFEILLFYNSFANFTFLAYHSYFYIFVDTSPSTHHIISVDTYYDLIHLLSFDMNQIYALSNPLINLP